jgi:site-specific recombinase XerD
MARATRAIPFEELWASYVRKLRAERKRDRTIETYSASVSQFVTYCQEQGWSTAPADWTRAHIQQFIDHLNRKRSPATSSIRFRALKTFLGWLEEEAEIPESPMARMRGPRVPVLPPQVMDMDTIARLMKTCSGRSFDDRRDTAMFRLMLDTGMRRGELASIRVADLNLRDQVVRVSGKTGVRDVPFGAKVALDLDRYLRIRATHPSALSPYLWIGRRGALTGNGIHSVVERRAREAGLDQKIWPHLFRHTFAHMFLSGEGKEGDAMVIGGWKSRSMLDRYGASGAAQRARQAQRERSVGDRL